MVFLTNMINMIAMNMANIKLTSQILMMPSHIGVMGIPLPDDDDEFYCDYDDGYCQGGDDDVYGDDDDDNGDDDDSC